MLVEILPDCTAVWVTDSEKLDSYCERWKEQNYLAMDTEFMREHTFYPSLGLVQVASPATPYEVILIDPLAIGSHAGFRQLMADESVLKVIHGGAEDVEVITRWLQQSPVPLFDTQIASGILGFGLQESYRAMVMHFLNADLDKIETRSDWLKRPLTRAQIQYAALDVKFLPPMYQCILNRIEKRGRLPWVMQDSALLLWRLQQNQALDTYYHRFGQVGFLPIKQRQVLYQLCCWREQEARAQNQPRNFIAPNQMLWQIAEQPPRTVAEFKRLLHRRYVNYQPKRYLRYGAVILEIIQRALAMPESEAPDVPMPKLNKDILEVIYMMKDVIIEISDRLRVATAVIISKRLLIILMLRVAQRLMVAQGIADERTKINAELPLPEPLEGWRKPIIVEPLQRVLHRNKEVLLRWYQATEVRS